jgi:predicted Zn-dependent protease
MTLLATLLLVSLSTATAPLAAQGTTKSAPPAAANDGVDPRLKPALAKFERGDRDGAKQALDALVRGAPNDLGLTLEVATLLVLQQEYVAAEPYARTVYAKAPQEPQSHKVLGGVLLFTDRAHEAEPLFRAAVARFHGTGDDPELVFDLGMACALNSKRTEASEHFERAIELDPKNALYVFSAAENDLNLQRLDRAESGFRKALAAKPPHPDAGWKLAVTLAAREKPKEAEPLFQQAVTSGPPPTRWNAAFHYAVFLFEAGRPAEALPLLEKATQTRPKDRMAWSYLARTLRALGRKDEAAAAVKRFQELQAEADRAENDYLLGLLRSQLSGGAAPGVEKGAPSDR